MKKSMSTFRHGTRRILHVFENQGVPRDRLLSSVRRASTANKIEDGTNGEKIFKSPFPKGVYPTMPLHEYVWENAGKWSEKIALKCGITGRAYKYREARDASNWVARSLLNIGLKNGDVVALVLPNVPETAIAFLGTSEAGLIATTVNPLYTVDEIGKQLANSEAKAVITTAELGYTVLRAAKSSMPDKFPLIVIDDGTRSIPPGSIPFKDLIDRGKTLPAVPSKPWTPDDVAVLPYSSGTTGLAKGVMLTHRNLINNMIQQNISTSGDAWQETTETHQEIVPAVLPFFHIYGMNAIMLPDLRMGMQIVTLPKFTPQGFIDVIAQNKATCLFLVPPLILFLTSSPNVNKKHLEAVRVLTCGAAPVAKTDILRFYERFQIDDTKLKFFQGYGLTECSPVTFIKAPKENNYAGIGVPISDSEARLVDPETNEDIWIPGRTGELWVRGCHVMKGYHKNEEATERTIAPGGWLKTGDLAYLDDDLDFHIMDRLKELIKVKGFQVPPAELEALLRTHPDIEEAAVIGIPDPRSGEVPKAFVTLKKDRTLKEKEVQEFVKGKVAEYKELRGGVSFVDSIPKNASGKILRRALKNPEISK
ncbi:4-coumarate--CoA ligase 1-like isoform X2 [Athalia rosae]|nr:4-coumarate--CoA ligase 1-like isoform X2 [Athalia rosae]XP_020710125.2 4-coumarate--CoA ligase 1-like isoform X2 [Athalia rosae]